MFVKKSWNKRSVSYEIVQSYRVRGAKYPKHKVLSNITTLPIGIINKIKILLKYPDAEIIKDLSKFFKDTRNYGGIVFFYLLMEKLGMLKAMECVPGVSKLLMIAIIINRIMEPRSKLGSVSWIKETAFGLLTGIGEENLEVEQIYKSMDIFHRKMEEVGDNFLKENKEGTKLLLYDITSVFFEGSGPEGLAKHGYSRDKRGDRPQILLTLCLNEEKMPVYFDVLEGNVSDKKTVIPFIEEIKKKYDIGECIFIGDRGMISIENIEGIKRVGIDYIIALTHTSARELLWDRGIRQKEIFDKEIPVSILEGEGIKYVLCGSEYRREHDRELLEKKMRKGRSALESVGKMVEKGRIKDKNKVLRRAQKKLTKSEGEKFYDFTYDGNKFEIIENGDYIEMAKNLCGYYILETTKIEMKEKEVEENYKKLKHVERAFRELKEIVEIRPIFHWKERRVRTHIFLCILAQVLVSKAIEILKESGWLDEKHSFEKFLDVLSNIQIGLFEIEKAKKWIISELKKEQEEVVKLFNMNLKYFKNPYTKLNILHYPP